MQIWRYKNADQKSVYFFVKKQKCTKTDKSRRKRKRCKSTLIDSVRSNCARLTYETNTLFKTNYARSQLAVMGTMALFTSGATSAPTFSVAVAAAPLLFFVTSDKRQRRCFFSQKSASASALFFKQIFCRCRYC